MIKQFLRTLFDLPAYSVDHFLNKGIKHPAMRGSSTTWNHCINSWFLVFNWLSMQPRSKSIFGERLANIKEINIMSLEYTAESWVQKLKAHRASRLLARVEFSYNVSPKARPDNPYKVKGTQKLMERQHLRNSSSTYISFTGEMLERLWERNSSTSIAAFSNA